MKATFRLRGTEAMNNLEYRSGDLSEKNFIFLLETDKKKKVSFFGRIRS